MSHKYRHLDTWFNSVERDGKNIHVCWTDLTPDEQQPLWNELSGEEKEDLIQWMSKTFFSLLKVYDDQAENEWEKLAVKYETISDDDNFFWHWNLVLCESIVSFADRVGITVRNGEEED